MDRLVQLYHAFLPCSVLDKPAVKRVVEDWFIRTPAMRIVVYMLLDIEGSTILLHLHTKDNVQVLGFL